MAYPEQKYTVTGKGPSYPNAATTAGTVLLAKDSLGNLAYVSASQIQTTLDSEGLATDADITSLSGSVAAKMANTSFAYVTGSFANDTAAQAAGIPIGGLYHTSGTVKVRLT